MNEALTPSQTLLWGICDLCKGHRQPICKEGRYFPHRGVLIEVPRNHPISRCATCGKDHLDPEQAERLVEVLAQEYAQQANLIQKIQERDPRDPRGLQN